MELAEIKRAADSDRLSLRDAERILNHARSEFEQKLATAEKSVLESKESLLSLKGDYIALEGQLQSKQNECKKLSYDLEINNKRLAEIESLQKLPVQVRIQRLEHELNESKAQVVRLSESLTAADAHNVSLKQIASDSECALNSLRESSALFQEHVKLQREKEEEQRKRLEARIAELNDQLRNVEIDGERKLFDEGEKCKDLFGRLETARADIVILKAEKETLQDRINQLVADCEAHLKSSKDSQNMYYSSVEQHANTMKSLKHFQSAAETAQSDVESLQIAFKALESKLAIANNALESLKNSSHDDFVVFSSKNKELSERNEVLLAQLELFSRVQNADVQKEIANISGSAMAESDVESSVANLQNIIRFLRIEKEIAETELEKTSTTVSQLRIEVETKTRTIGNLTAELDGLKKSAPAAQPASNSTNSTQLLLLQDSNTLLREESVRLRERCQFLESEIIRLKDAELPIQKHLQLLQAEKDSWNVEKQFLITENEKWKTRTEQVLTRYHQIDPEVHNQLLAAHSELKLQKESLEHQLEASSSLQELLTKALAELKVEKELVVKVRQESLRFKSLNEALKKAIDESTKNKAIDASSASRLKLAEDAKSKSDAATSEMRNVSVKKIEALVVLLNESRILLKNRSTDVGRLTKANASATGEITALKLEMVALKESGANLLAKEKEKFEKLRNAFEIKLAHTQRELDDCNKKIAEQIVLIQKLEADSVVLAPAIAAPAVFSENSAVIEAAQNVLPANEVQTSLENSGVNEIASNNAPSLVTKMAIESNDSPEAKLEEKVAVVLPNCKIRTRSQAGMSPAQIDGAPRAAETIARPVKKPKIASQPILKDAKAANVIEEKPAEMIPPVFEMNATDAVPEAKETVTVSESFAQSINPYTAPAQISAPEMVIEAKASAPTKFTVSNPIEEAKKLAAPMDVDVDSTQSIAVEAQLPAIVNKNEQAIDIFDEPLLDESKIELSADLVESDQRDPALETNYFQDLHADSELNTVTQNLEIYEQTKKDVTLELLVETISVPENEVGKQSSKNADVDMIDLVIKSSDDSNQIVDFFSKESTHPDGESDDEPSTKEPDAELDTDAIELSNSEHIIENNSLDQLEEVENSEYSDALNNDVNVESLNSDANADTLNTDTGELEEGEKLDLEVRSPANDTDGIKQMDQQ